jgi:hypothetical protein
MEQRDYILREIEKIGAIIIAIRHMLFGESGGPAVTDEAREETLKEMLLNEASLDLDELLALDTRETDSYLAAIKGLNVENIELLAKLLSDIAVSGDGTFSAVILGKALQLYEICSIRDKTYSFGREEEISRIKELLRTGTGY